MTKTTPLKDDYKKASSDAWKWFSKHFDTEIDWTKALDEMDVIIEKHQKVSRYVTDYLVLLAQELNRK